MTHENYLHAILPHASEPHILVMPNETGWTLPRFQPQEIADDDFDLYEHGMHSGALMGCKTATLYCPYFERKSEDYRRFVFVLENRDSAFQPPEGARWVNADEFDGLGLAHAYVRPWVEAYFYERASGIYPRERPPWAFPGWLDRAHAWITSQVTANGWTLTGEIELVRKWCITCVLKAPTDAGDLFFKAVPPTFFREVSVTRFLAELFPENIPTIVAANEAERWMLLRDFGQAVLGESNNAADWERALRDFAALQVTMTQHIDALLERGAQDFGMGVLAEKLDVLLADDTVLTPDAYITAEEIEQARRLAPRIRALIAELDSYGLPPTIVHSDFHLWNTAVQDGRIIFFDWTDTSVGHPFFDMSLFFAAMRRSEVFADQPEMIDRLCETYLQALTPLAPLETLRKALPLGEIAGSLHQAVNYHHLVRSIEPADHWSINYAGTYIKKLLTQMEGLEEVEGRE